MVQKHKTVMSKIFHSLWTTFLNGLFTLLPLTLTIALFSFSLRLIKGWLAPIQNLLVYTPLRLVPHSEIVLIVLFILLVGVILRVFILRTVIHALEDVIVRIPLIRPVYSGIKQLVDAFTFKEDKASFKQVVCVEFPRKGLYSIGFLTGEMPTELTPTKEDRFFNVFVPTTPNPTTGYFIIIPEKEIIQIPLTRHEAMALIISGGIILPEQFENKK